ncbi:hypothetical protein NBRC116601_10000 [Cognatishimia sp. WU-CL00825]|uniref:hypothetical protein n=1 Tax=Cognatishimia sp. WU-CL00825 TaxID=3127658 RepID=UPI003108C6F0
MNEETGKSPRLILHIGSQKTGTTTIQGFLKNQTENLASAGLHFVRAGRTNIAHNSVLQSIKKGQGDLVAGDILSEIGAQPENSCSVISSEMFFRKGIAAYFKQHFPQDLRARTRVLVYLRRQDKYAEAMYKQRVKNGRFRGSPSEYLKNVVKLNYDGILQEFADAFGQDNLIVRPFERCLLAKGDVLRDFVQHASLTESLVVNYKTAGANATLSRQVSEQLGTLRRAGTSVNTRDIIRHIMRHKPAGAIQSGDCFDLETRRALLATYATENELIRSTFCPDLPALFDMADLFDNKAYAAPSEADLELKTHQAAQAINAAIDALNPEN